MLDWLVFANRLLLCKFSSAAGEILTFMQIDSRYGLTSKLSDFYSLLRKALA